ncbi:MAG: hypothetical protein DRP85_08330 [Candidatus Makaraimicrobium thalassicum]|nr:MAG: hypothetical protein DRP85_08330 [Candidatus Omnitrophota bacterium]
MRDVMIRVLLISVVTWCIVVQPACVKTHSAFAGVEAGTCFTAFGTSLTAPIYEDMSVFEEKTEITVKEDRSEIKAGEGNRDVSEVESGSVMTLVSDLFWNVTLKYF